MNTGRQAASSRRRKTLSPTRVAALLRESTKILGELRENDDENSPPMMENEAVPFGGDSAHKDLENQEVEGFSKGSAGGVSSARATRLHGSVSCLWESGTDQSRALEGELWVSEGSLHWSPSPMSDITNRSREAPSSPLSAGLRLAATDVTWIRSVKGNKRPTIEIKLTTSSEPVVLTFNGPGSVSAAMAAVETYPSHLYLHDKVETTPVPAVDKDPAGEPSPEVASPPPTATLELLIREFMMEPRQSARSRAIAKQVHSMTGYPLLPFGVSVVGPGDADPLPQRDAPLTDSDKRSLIMALVPLYDSVNRARHQAAKDSEALIDIRAERSDDGSYRYTDISTQQLVSPDTYRTRYLKGLAITSSSSVVCVETRGSDGVERAAVAVSKPEDKEESQAQQPQGAESRGATNIVTVRQSEVALSSGTDKGAAQVEEEEADEDMVMLREVEAVTASSASEAVTPAVVLSREPLPTSLEEVRSRAQKRLFEAIDAALNRYHNEIACAEAVFGGTTTRSE